MTRLSGFVLAGLAVALLAGVVLSGFASPAPDGLESAVLKSQCAGAPDPDACLARVAGDPVYDAAPLPGYRVTWLSGGLGVLACFAGAAGLAALARRRGGHARGRAAPPPDIPHRVG